MIDTKRLAHDGIVLDAPMPTQKIDEIIAHLQEGIVHHCHVARRDAESAMYVDMQHRDWTVFASRTFDVVTAPHWLEQAISYYDAAKEYFSGRDPYLYSLNAFWTLPSKDKYVDTQGWHRDDGDGRDQFTIFMFGSDVSYASRHEYARGTHHAPYPSTLESDRDVPPDDIIIPVYGPRGIIMVEDTHGLHRAAPTLDSLRLLLWARWGTSRTPPQSSVSDRLSPIDRSLI
jgi:hypothetical protein